jgi:hypothetical protein
MPGRLERSRVGPTLEPGASFWLAWVLHALHPCAEGLWGDPPRFGFAPALSVTSVAGC